MDVRHRCQLYKENRLAQGSDDAWSGGTKKARKILLRALGFDDNAWVNWDIRKLFYGLCPNAQI